MTRYMLVSVLALLGRAAGNSVGTLLHDKEHYVSEFALWTKQYNVAFASEAEYSARLEIFAVNR